MLFSSSVKEEVLIACKRYYYWANEFVITYL